MATNVIAMDTITSGTGRLDSNGDEILYEGVLYRRLIKWNYTLNFKGLNIFKKLLLCCFLPLAYRFFVTNWCIYITKKGIYYNYPDEILPCLSHLMFIPIGDIRDIYVQQGTSYFVEVRNKVPEDSSTECWVGWVESGVTTLGPLRDPDEFVAAVKNVLAQP